MNEYRCTRNSPYSNPNCFGHTDLEARQGYYLKAQSKTDAIALMAQLYPDDQAGFTVEPWKIACPVCRGSGHQTPHTLMWDGTVKTGDPVTCDFCQGVGRVELAELEAYRAYIDAV